MSDTAKPALVDGGKAIILCAAIGALIGVVSLQGLPADSVAFALMLLPFLPLPIALLTARHGIMAGSLTGIIFGLPCTAWVVITGSSTGLLVFLFAAVAGVIAGAGFRSDTGIYRMLVRLMLVFIGAILVWFGAYSFTVGAGPLEVLKDFAATTAAQMGDIYREAGIISGSPEEASSQVYDFITQSLPALLIIAAGLMSIITVTFARFIFRVAKQAFPPDIEFSELRLHFGFVYLFIASLGLYLAAYFMTGGDTRTWIGAAAQNLMMLTTALFFIQGLAIASWFLRRRQASGIMKSAVYVILGILEGLIQLVSFVGIFDVFMDFRKRYGEKSGRGRVNDQ